MNIFYVSDSELHVWSVHTVHINEVCKHLSTLGNRLTLFVPGSKKVEGAPYKIVTIRAPKILRSAFYQPALFFRLWAGIKKQKPDLLYVRQSQFLFVPIVCAKRFRVPVVLEVNGRLLEESKQADTAFVLRALLTTGIFRRIEAFNVRNSSALIVVAREIKEYVVQEYGIDPSRINVISNGVDTASFKPSKASSFKKQFSPDGSVLCVGYIGSLRPWQGLRYVVEAAAIISKKRPGTKFFIIGDGDDKDYLINFVRENALEWSVEVHAAVSHTMVPDCINAMDICISYPIRSRVASPFKVYEYLACGKATIIADSKGVREEFGDVVRYAKPESALDLADSIEGLLADEQKRIDLGARGVRFIESGHSWKDVASKIALVCERVATS